MTQQETGQRVALVTGAARGIRAATAIRLARDGIAVAVLDLGETDTKPVVDEIVENDGTALGLGADVADEEAVARAVGLTAERLGPATVLVNNAGIVRDDLILRCRSRTRTRS